MSRVCPLGLGACALVNEVPGDEVGDFAVTGGSGGSVTSSSVKTGFGAWAGGIAFTRFKKNPGRTGDMYGGARLSFVPKHRFPAREKTKSRIVGTKLILHVGPSARTS